MSNFHARKITNNYGWKINFDRLLNVFQWFDSSALNAATNLQEAQLTKGGEVNFIKTETK